MFSHHNQICIVIIKAVTCFCILFSIYSLFSSPHVCVLVSPSPAGSNSIPEFFRIMTRQFTAHEWSTIQSAGSERQQLAAFYRHWVTMATILPCHHTALLPGATGGGVRVWEREKNLYILHVDAWPPFDSNFTSTFLPSSNVPFVSISLWYTQLCFLSSISSKTWTHTQMATVSKCWAK